MDVTEKRKSVRIPVDFPASFSHGTRNLSGRILNLSVDGALLRAEELLDSGELIHLTFDLPEHEVRVKGRIMWGGSVDAERTFGMGLFFEDIPAVQQAAIELYIRNLLKI